MEFRTECPNCRSDKIRVINMNYPKAYECDKCEFNFVAGKQSLIDE